MDTDKRIDTSCGLTKSCKPRWLQRFSNVKTFLIVLTLIAIVRGFAINGINSANTIMYERRYQLTSKVTSLITVFEDVISGLVGVVIGYYGATRHQPRVIAISVIVFCFGLFIMCMAQFAAPPYNPVLHGSGNGSSDSNMCTASDDKSLSWTEGDSQIANVKNYVYLLFVGQMLNGYSGACLTTLGITFIESSSSSAKSALYLGIFAGGSVIGPALGYLSGGALLDVYVDFPSSPPDGLTPKDPAWVGAWWLGFVIALVLSAILAFIMFFFAQEFEDTAAIRAAKVSEAHETGIEDKIKKPGFGMSLKHLPKATWYLLKNSCFMCISVVDALEFGVVISCAVFLPKLFVAQFQVSPNWASTLTGILATFSAIFGEITGGAIIKRWDFNVRQILKFALVSSILAMCTVPVFFARCPEVEFAGVNVNYQSSKELERVNLSSTCNDGCGCTTAFYDPVCSDNIQYFSPCHAGCTDEPEILQDGTRVYHSCDCLLSANSTVIGGQCAVKCSLLYTVTMPFTILMLTFTFLLGTPMVTATLRVVPAQLRTYGLAVHTLFVRFLGSVPIPVIFGAVIDSSCIVWQDNNGEKGSCWVYDNQQLSLRLVILLLSIKVISILFGALAIVVYKPPSASAQESEEGERCLDDIKKEIN